MRWRPCYTPAVAPEGGYRRDNGDASQSERMSEKKQSFHMPSLDGIRAVSILIVFFAHAGAGRVVPGGFGVTVFFFLSGFLITTLLRREYAKTGTVSFSHFYLRRVLRIFPPFYGALALAVVVLFLGLLPEDVDWAGVGWLAIHWGNYAQMLDLARLPPGTSVYWSLAVEEHYYLTFPLLALALLRKGDARVSFVVLTAVGLGVLAWRVYLVGQGAPEARTYLGSDTRVDSILWGCVLAFVKNPALDPPLRMGTPARLVVLLGAALVLGFCFVYRDSAFRETYRYTLQGIALIPVFYFAVAHPQWPLFRFLNWPAVSHLGVLSYTFYLVHQIFLNVAEHQASELSVWLRGVLVFGVTTLTAELSLRYLERPVARLRARYRQ